MVVSGVAAARAVLPMVSVVRGGGSVADMVRAGITQLHRDGMLAHVVGHLTGTKVKDESHNDV
jgi:hypothetical protein